MVTERDPRFKGKVVLVDVFGTWCPTCHDAAPALVQLYRKYRAGSRDRQAWHTR
jgi:thiol-disulfide isomerase/thioredoxin